MMQRKAFLRTLGVGTAGLVCRNGWGAGRKRPNVVLVLTDDQGYGDLSCHGNPVLRTPNLDKLHAQSIRFTDFHVAPMCTPSRGQLLTGRDAMANGATFVCLGRSMMRESLPTMADIFATNGYRTGHFGKWHLGDSYPYRPQDRGFEETLHHGAWGITSIADYWGNDYWNDTYRLNDALEEQEGYCTDVWFDKAMAYMKRRQAAGEPFFLYLPTNCPHSPHWVDDEFSGDYASQGLPRNVDKFFGQIANVDENIGRLTAMLDDSGLADNTLFIFMTDNGTVRGHEVYNAGMRGKKTEAWEGGHRVPCFVRWPAGNLGDPRDIDELTECQDILPTLIDMCGLEISADVEFDGVSLADMLRGDRDRLDDRMLVVEYGPDDIERKYAVLWKKWRLVMGEQLYDLRDDSHQDKDVAAERPDILAAMRKHYDEWQKKVRPLHEEKRYIHLGSEKANPVMLYSSDWFGSYADNWSNLAKGDRIGVWDVIVERIGEYKFTLSRWHPAAETALDARLEGPMGKGTAVPIAQARLNIGDVDVSKQTAAGQKEVTFTVKLKAGKTQLSTWFLDKDGAELCSAYYTLAERQ
jgi:arylsulfatase A-like enzyme